MSGKPPNVMISVSPDGKPILSLTLTCHEDIKVIVINGELDLATVHVLMELVDRVAVDRPARVVLDMAGVTFFCAAGLNALLQAQQAVTGVGGRLLLRPPSRVTRTVLTITDTAHMFLVDPSPAGCLTASDAQSARDDSTTETRRTREAPTDGRSEERGEELEEPRARLRFRGRNSPRSVARPA